MTTLLFLLGYIIVIWFVIAVHNASRARTPCHLLKEPHDWVWTASKDGVGGNYVCQTCGTPLGQY
jgi:hypothetical protein